MKFYISARYGRKEEARALALEIQGLEHTITSLWLWQVESEMGYAEGNAQTIKFARRDVQEIDDCDVFVALSEVPENPWGRGGRHVEFGAAMRIKKQLIVIGPLENLFHYLPEVTVYSTKADFLYHLRMAGD